MRTNKLWLPIAFAFAAASVAGCHSSEPSSTTAPPPPPPASVQQTGAQMQEYQIDHSNLTPDQKQRALSQIKR